MKPSDLKKQIEKREKWIEERYKKEPANIPCMKDEDWRLFKLKIELKTWQEALKEVKKLIEDIDIELFLTDIKNKEGEKVYCSDEFMKIIQLWWDEKSEELKSKLIKL